MAALEPQQCAMALAIRERHTKPRRPSTRLPLEKPTNHLGEHPMNEVGYAVVLATVLAATLWFAVGHAPILWIAVRPLPPPVRLLLGFVAGIANRVMSLREGLDPYEEAVVDVAEGNQLSVTLLHWTRANFSALRIGVHGRWSSGSSTRARRRPNGKVVSRPNHVC
jgi:hypothetical protein